MGEDILTFIRSKQPFTVNIQAQVHHRLRDPTCMDFMRNNPIDLTKKSMVSFS